MALFAIVAMPAARAVDAPGTAKVAPLGDMNPYIAIVKDTQQIAKSGDLAKARTRIRDLEKSWDADEDKNRPKNPSGWDTADQTMDKAIGKLRASKPDAAAVDTALNDLIATLESLNQTK
jgi:hypothetical protein